MKRAVLVLCLFAVVLTATALNGVKAPAGVDPSGKLKSTINMSVAEQNAWIKFTGKPVSSNPCVYCGCLAQRRETRQCSKWGLCKHLLV